MGLDGRFGLLGRSSLVSRRAEAAVGRVTGDGLRGELAGWGERAPVAVQRE